MLNFKKLKFTKKYFFIFGIVIFLLFLSSITVYALNIWNSGYRIDTETKEVKVGSSQACHKVTNTSSNSYFIPTKTTAEWDAFANNSPSGVTIGSCCVSYQGNSCGGSSCIYAGTYNCSGSCTGTSYKQSGISCGTNKECDGSGNCVSSCVSNYGDSCGGSVCVNAGTINCSGSCTGTSDKPAGTSCGVDKECNGSGSCIDLCGDCTASNTVSCGQSYSDSCGNPCGTGTKCLNGTCIGGLCKGTWQAMGNSCTLYPVSHCGNNLGSPCYPIGKSCLIGGIDNSDACGHGHSLYYYRQCKY